MPCATYKMFGGNVTNVMDVIGRIKARTDKFQCSLYPHCVSEWNKLDPEIRLAPYVAVFKKNVLSIIRPPAKSKFGIHDPIGLSYLTQLRVGLSKLNFHKFNHNFRDTIKRYIWVLRLRGFTHFFVRFSGFRRKIARFFGFEHCLGERFLALFGSVLRFLI